MPKKLSLWLLLVVGVTLTTHAQDDTNLFTLYSDQPVIAHGDSGDWDFQFTDPGAVIYHDGKFHMFRNGFNGWPASVQIGYLTSDDGLKWTEVSPDPVMLTKDVPYARVAALASDVLVQDDGTWVMYFYTWNTRSGANEEGEIGRATAAAPTGPWIPDAEPILTAGSKGSWDDLRVSAPRVIKTESGYTMYYSAIQHNARFYTNIGMATSPDGITWTKYNDPATTDTLYAESDPVLTTGDKKEFIGQPMVQQTPDGWTMLYRTAQGTGSGMKIGFSTSQDGIHWAYNPANNFWDVKSIPGSDSFWYTAAVYHDDTYFLYIEGSTNQQHTQIYVATHQGSLVSQ